MVQVPHLETYVMLRATEETEPAPALTELITQAGEARQGTDSEMQ